MTDKNDGTRILPNEKVNARFIIDTSDETSRQMIEMILGNYIESKEFIESLKRFTVRLPNMSAPWINQAFKDANCMVEESERVMKRWMESGIVRERKVEE